MPFAALQLIIFNRYVRCGWQLFDLFGVKEEFFGPMGWSFNQTLFVSISKFKKKMFVISRIGVATLLDSEAPVVYKDCE